MGELRSPTPPMPNSSDDRCSERTIGTRQKNTVTHMPGVVFVFPMHF